MLYLDLSALCLRVRYHHPQALLYIVHLSARFTDKSLVTCLYIQTGKSVQTISDRNYVLFEQSTVN